MGVETHQGRGKCEWWGNKNIILNTRTNSSMLTYTSSVHEPTQTNRFTDTGGGWGVCRGVGQGRRRESAGKKTMMQTPGKTILSSQSRTDPQATSAAEAERRDESILLPFQPQPLFPNSPQKETEKFARNLLYLIPGGDV